MVTIFLSGRWTLAGYLNSHPDHWTQGVNFDDLKDYLRDFYDVFSAEDIPGIRKVEEVEVA